MSEGMLSGFAGSNGPNLAELASSKIKEDHKRNAQAGGTAMLGDAAGSVGEAVGNANQLLENVVKPPKKVGVGTNVDATTSDAPPAVAGSSISIPK